MSYDEFEMIKVDVADEIAWVMFNRPEKRNAVNPQMHAEMEECLKRMETDADIRVIVLTGAGESYCAGMDLQQFFRENDGDPGAQWENLRRSRAWAWERLTSSNKATVAMVNGYCFGGAFSALCNVDIVISADEATYGLSEVNWGILPGGIVSKVFADTVNQRDALFYAMTGRTFDGPKAVEMGVANISVPLKDLKAETLKLCEELKNKSPMVLAYTKQAIRNVRTMDVPQAYDYLMAKSIALQAVDKTGTRTRGMEEFLDKKNYRPGFQSVDEVSSG